MPLEDEFKIIRTVLDPEISRRITHGTGGIGDTIQAILGEYQPSIRKERSILENQLDELADKIENGFDKILKDHVSISEVSGGIPVIAASVKESLIREYFGYDKAQFKDRYRHASINNYDDFLTGLIQFHKENAESRLFQKGAEKVQNIMLDTRNRERLFQEFRLPFGYSWTDYAVQDSKNYGMVARMIQANLGGQLSKQLAENSQNHIKYGINVVVPSAGEVARFTQRP
jgi:hypothetical protein